MTLSASKALFTSRLSIQDIQPSSEICTGDISCGNNGTQVLIPTGRVTSVTRAFTSDTTRHILELLERYRLHNPRIQSKPLYLVEKFLSQIERFVARGEPVSMVLPAFPFKSANKSTKVLGTLPDKGEEVALIHLNSLCEEISKVYKHGAWLYIVSDGLVYNGKHLHSAVHCPSRCDSQPMRVCSSHVQNRYPWSSRRRGLAI